jgi:hypothetical protein
MFYFHIVEKLDKEPTMKSEAVTSAKNWKNVKHQVSHHPHPQNKQQLFAEH